MSDMFNDSADYLTQCQSRYADLESRALEGLVKYHQLVLPAALDSRLSNLTWEDAFERVNLTDTQIRGVNPQITDEAAQIGYWNALYILALAYSKRDVAGTALGRKLRALQAITESHTGPDGLAWGMLLIGSLPRSPYASDQLIDCAAMLSELGNPVLESSIQPVSGVELFRIREWNPHILANCIQAESCLRIASSAYQSVCEDVWTSFTMAFSAVVSVIQHSEGKELDSHRRALFLGFLATLEQTDRTFTRLVSSTAILDLCLGIDPPKNDDTSGVPIDELDLIQWCSELSDAVRRILRSIRVGSSGDVLNGINCAAVVTARLFPPA